MNQPARSQEPSMEEILASIRRIIADDDASKTAQRPPDAPRAEAPPLPPLPPPQEIPDVFAAPPPPPPAPPPRVQAEPAPRIEFEPPPPPPPPVVEEPVAFHQETVADQAADILDLTESMAAALDPSPPVPQFRTIDGSSDVGFDEAAEPPLPDLPSYAPFPPAAPRLHDDQGRLISGATSAAVDSAFNALAQTVLSQNARTLEDLVREMLRPMLKSWLDDNLPGMVERMVRAEIERASRGRPG
jgi:cell pole-organizing protein PopZ